MFIRNAWYVGAWDHEIGRDMYNLNAITPETDRSAHYFWAQAYNFKLDQAWISARARC